MTDGCYIVRNGRGAAIYTTGSRNYGNFTAPLVDILSIFKDILQATYWDKCMYFGFDGTFYGRNTDACGKKQNFDQIVEHDETL